MARKENFGKIYRDIYYSTIAEDHNARLVFMDMVILSDEDGVMKLTLPAFQRTTNVPMEKIEAALELLTSPDPESTTEDYDGRRLIPAENGQRGWVVVNKKKYWSRHISPQRREQENKRKQKERDLERQETQPIPIDKGPDSPEDGAMLFQTTASAAWIRPKKIKTWQEKYPDMDIRLELEDAQAWLELNVEKRKKASGLHTWLGTWLSNSKKSGKYHRRDIPDVDFSPSDTDKDPHHPSHDGTLDITGERIYSSKEGHWVNKDDFVPLETDA